jgi:Na+/H+-translocating membrane pyrophosphatase
MFTQNPNWLLPVIESGWEISPIFAIFVLWLTVSSIIRLAAYAIDRRKHFYPFLAASLVAAMTFSFWEVFLFAIGRMPAQLQVGLSTTPVNTSIFLCFLVLVFVTILQGILPLTKAQKRKRSITVVSQSSKTFSERKFKLR